MTDLLFPTIPGVTPTGNALCDYKTLPTATVHPTQVTPSSTPPPPPVSRPPPQPSPDLAVIIYREDYCDDISCSSVGHVYDIKPGEPVDCCSNPSNDVDRFAYTESAQNDTSDYPISSEKFTSHGSWKNCQYVGHANEVGTFSCDGFDKPVQCIIPTAGGQSCNNAHSLAEDQFTPIVYCEWHSI